MHGWLVFFFWGGGEGRVGVGSSGNGGWSFGLIMYPIWGIYFNIRNPSQNCNQENQMFTRQYFNF